MSAVLATTRVAVYRGTTKNALGDEVDNSDVPISPAMASLPASIIETTKNVQDPATGTWRKLPKLTCRMVNPSLDIREGDRVRDLRTGKVMTVDSVTRTSRSLAASAGLTLDLTDRAA